DLGDAQMTEAPGQPREALQRVALHDLRVKRGKHSCRARYALDVRALVVEQHDADRVELGRVAQRVEVSLDAAVAAFAGQSLEINRDLRRQHVEADPGSTSTEYALSGKEVGAFRVVSAFREGSGHCSRAIPCVAVRSVSHPVQSPIGTAPQNPHCCYAVACATF